MQVIPVILSGGAGTRLWPLSRKHYPKQFHRLTGGEHTLLQETALRVQHLAAPIVVCNEDHRFMLAEQLHSIGIKPAAILLEPEAKNTAPAIALAAIKALQIDPQAIIAVFPADHVIRDQHAFQQAQDIAAKAAATGNELITFGIVPTHPETGYGYIEAGDADFDQGERDRNKGDAARLRPRAVVCFTEKPSFASAEQYLTSGKHLWNSGMFVFKAAAYLDALQHTAPAIVEHCQAAMRAARDDLDFIRVDAQAFAACPSDSIDYAVMEKVDNVRVVPLDAGWSDIGGWRAIWEILEKDASHTASIGDVITINTHNTLVHNDNKNKLVVTIGLDDLVVRQVEATSRSYPGEDDIVRFENTFRRA
jgi:mannose-1-phosphate guanylyltransferase/mannose-6-phosphate isomerase